MELKKGDKLVCHKEIIINNGKKYEKVTTLGKSYQVINIYADEAFFIINDSNITHDFTIKSYKKWFTEKNKLRKKKLRKLYEYQRI